MEALARISGEGQVTVPELILDALGWVEGDMLVFRVEGDHAVLAVVPDLLDLASAVGVPDEVGGMTWVEVRRRAWEARGEEVIR